MATVAPALTASRPTRFDRLVLLIGATLIRWGERRVAHRAISHEERSRQLAIQRERSAFDQSVLKQWYRGER